MRRISALLAIGLALPAVAAGAGKDVKLSLVAYSTPKDAYAKLIPAFQKTAAGKGVSFSQYYGASGDQARAVAAGLAADVFGLSLATAGLLSCMQGIAGSGWATALWDGA